MQNFFNYYGKYDDNIYEFKEGINIVVADNGAGKSKLFNALLWVFYDELLDSDIKARRPIESMAIKTISDKAKNEVAIGNSVTCGVCVEFQDTRKIYKIVKSFTATRVSDKGNVTDESSWEINSYNFEVDEKEKLLKTFKPIFDENEKHDIVNKLIRKDLRQYSFFQGEEVEDIIDFSKKKSIKDAVRKITNISKIEKLEDLALYLQDRAENEYNTKSKEKAKNSEKLEEKLKQQEGFKKQKEDAKSNLEVFKETHSQALQESHDLLDKIQNSEKKIGLQNKRKDYLKRRRIAINTYEQFLDGINSKFFDGSFSWLALGLESVPKSFLKEKDVYFEGIYQKRVHHNLKNSIKEGLHNILPFDMPDTMTLDKMLQDEHCYVCNRNAEKHSEAWKHMLKLKNRPVTEQKENHPFKNNFRSFFEDIQLQSQSFTGKIQIIEESIGNTVGKIDDLKNNISRLDEKIKRSQNELKELLRSDDIDEGIEKEKNNLNSYEAAIIRETRAAEKITRLTEEIKTLKKKIEAVGAEIDQLRGTNVPSQYKDAYELLTDVSNAITLTREKTFENMLRKLEEYSNKHFRNLIKYNEMSGGILKFKQTLSDTIELNVVDEYNNEITGSSEGFQRMKKLAVVMAVISAKGSGFNYPLFADAPLSTFGRGFIKSFFEEIPNVFPQSIILINNIYDAESDNKLDDIGNDLLKNNEHVTTIYVNDVNDVPQIERITTKTKLK